MEFSVANGANYRIGLAVNNLLGQEEFSNSIFIDHNTGNGVAFEGSSSASLGNFQIGDVFRISREGNSVKYYRNGIILRTVTVNSSLELKVKACLYFTGRSTPNITTSFDCRLVVLGIVLGLEGNSGTGNISLSVSGGATPYTYNWSSGEQTSSIINKPRGSYTITVTDGLGRTQNRTYNIGYKVNWINPIGVSSNESILTKTASDQSWGSGAISSNILPSNTDGWMEFTGVNGANYRIGLAVNNTLSSSQFNNSVFINNNTGSGIAFEGGTSASLGSFQTGDVFRISREGSSVKYYKNETVLRMVTVNPSMELKVKACLYFTGSSTPHVNTSFWLSDGLSRTYYAVSNGNWTEPSVWSLTENGPPSTVYPDDIDKVVIKGHEVTVSSNVKSAAVTITSTNDDTRLKVDGSMAVLTVKGGIVMKREQGSNTAEVLLVQNNGKLDVK